MNQWSVWERQRSEPAVSDVRVTARAAGAESVGKAVFCTMQEVLSLPGVLNDCPRRRLLSQQKLAHDSRYCGAVCPVMSTYTGRLQISVPRGQYRLSPWESEAVYGGSDTGTRLES